MKIIYSLEPVRYDANKDLLFLVGPTPRSKDVPSWRPEAIDILTRQGYDGTVFVPESKDGKIAWTLHEQIEWEWEALASCVLEGSIAAWVPRELDKMPAFTTNVEFGRYVHKDYFFYGRPPGAPNTGYLDYMYECITGRKPCDTLEELMEQSHLGG